MNLADERKARVKEFCDGLRALADFLEAHPDLPGLHYHTETINLFARSDEDMAIAVRDLGSMKKEVDDNYFSLSKEFGPRVTLDVSRRRDEVCRRVVKGTRVVPAVPEKIIPAQPEREEEIVEWECPPSVLGALNGKAAAS